MQGFIRTVESFASFKRVPLKVVLITALTSYALQLGTIIQNQPLYIIALATLIPWVPVLAFESLWKVKHYHWIAVFAVVTMLQLGHLGEHVLQAGALAFTDATLACPPPADNAANAGRAVDAGLRDPNSTPTGLSSARIAAPDAAGQTRTDANGDPVVGIPACGVFGQLDLEIVHLIWDSIGWILTLVLLSRYPRSSWLWIAMFWSSVHTVEHLFISYNFFFDSTLAYEGTRQLWGTVADGSIVTAFPLGKETLHVTFYDVAGKFGIFARNGLAGSLIPSLNSILPTRPYLHLGYNALIVIPTLFAFVHEIRRTYDFYLAEALPNLSTEQLVGVTPKLEARQYKSGDVIVKQGDPADFFYIVSSGSVQVVHEEPDGSGKVVATLSHGQYFGEMGLVGGGIRIATVRAAGPVEVMRMDASTFASLMNSSETSKREMDRIVTQRRKEDAAFLSA
jgi:hypothetical protein